MLALGSLIGGLMLYRTLHSQPKDDSNRTTASRDTSYRDTSYRIAIFQPALHPALEEIARGFKEKLTATSTKHLLIDTYNAEGNSTLLRSQAEGIVQKQYDLVFTIGAHCSQLLYQLNQKKGDATPQVFAAVDDPYSSGIVKSLHLSGTQATGVLATRFYEQQIAALLQCKPTVKRVLLVYNPAQGTGLEKDRKKVELLLSKQGIFLQAVEVAHHNEIAQKVPSFLPKADVVLVLMDTTVVSGITSLIALCNRYKIPLYTSDLASGDKGAGLSFGATDYEYGAQGAELAHMILDQKKSPASLPLMESPPQKLMVNRAALQKQGLELSPEQVQQIQKEGGRII